MDKRRILFHRAFPPEAFKAGTSGGQQKVRDVFEYARQSTDFEPKVYFPVDTVWHDNPGNVWLPYRKEALKNWDPRPGDILFLAGKDWGQIQPDPTLRSDIPILAIAQPRHVRPEDPRHDFLQHRAIRIAKSRAGQEILQNHGVNGPVFLIPDAIDFSHLPAPTAVPETDLFIVGLKNPGNARELKARLEDHFGDALRIEIQDAKLPTREDFLAMLNRCRIACFFTVPPERGLEGFYLPALEAMVLEKLVVCPDAIGNRDFCLADKTCVMPADHSVDAYFDAVLRAVAMSDEEVREMKTAARAQAEHHRMESEREAYWELFGLADEIWRTESLFRN